ncbi:MAG: hypothetical protein Q4C99_03450 [Clostridia bacterium]|nr:hypothetical protein [Clostridia bacterium]
MFCQDNDFWEKADKQTVNENDIVEYIYSSKYLNIQNPVEYCKISNTYNTNLIRYFFEVEKYQNEKDYREIFFQGFLDGDIDKREYYAAEKSFKNFIKALSDKSDVYAYFGFTVPLENNSPFRNSSDVTFNLEFIRNSQDKFVEIVDDFQLEQISTLFAREIATGYFIFKDIKSVLLCSGMHGYVFSVDELNPELLNEVSSQVKIEKQKCCV